MDAYLCLEDGHVFKGKAIGAIGETVGELVFTTGMGGYIETLTDPSFFGQIVMQTFPQIGNYGMITDDIESAKSVIKGYVLHELCELPSNFRSEGNLESYLKTQGIVGICGVDTREITKLIRETGVMNACIVCDPQKANFRMLHSYVITEAVKSVSCAERKKFPALTEKRFTVGVLDCGSKQNIIRELQKRGCDVQLLPYDTSFSELLCFDGLMISNGPGNPRDNPLILQNLQQVFGKLPIFGICLGHQLLALAAGGSTSKLKYGHRGVNQPVKCLDDQKVYITSQNHGYAVESRTLPAFARVNYQNVNDMTCEGIEYVSKKAFSVQFHPEGCAGPQDTVFLFDKFIKMMGGEQ